MEMYANEVETKEKNSLKQIPMRGFWLKPPGSPFQFNVTISLNMSAGLQDLIP